MLMICYDVRSPVQPFFETSRPFPFAWLGGHEESMCEGSVRHDGWGQREHLLDICDLQQFVKTPVTPVPLEGLRWLRGRPEDLL